jgi:peptide/nickel transport system permease protein
MSFVDGKTRLDEQEKERYFAASQWQLIWWKFRKHKLAMIGAPVILFLYTLALFCEFLSPYTELTRFTGYLDAPPQRIRFYDKATGFRLRPFVYGLRAERDPETLRRLYIPDESKLIPLRFFVHGEPYKFWGLFEADLHLVGTDGEPVFFMGTDSLARDLFSRVIYGARISLSIGLVGILLTFVIGLLVGGISGYYGGLVDAIVQRIIDLLRSIPTLPLWMSLAAALPRDWPPARAYFGIVVVLSLVGWTSLARVVRGKFLSLRGEDFVIAAKLSGSSEMRIITRHLLPSFMSYVIVSITLSIPTMILSETALSFIGLGLQPPVVSWGVLLQDAQHLRALALHPWLLIPCFFVIATVLMFNFLGDGLRDAADPYTR